MVQKTIFNLVALCFIGVILAFIVDNDADVDRIYWNSDKKLTWSDFRAIPNMQHPYQSITSCNTTYSTAFKNDSVLFTIKCFMNPNKSWVKNNQKTDELLRHEQLHFDITELYARSFRKELSAGKYYLQTAHTELKIKASKYSFLRSKIQDEYDLETDHSKIAIKQKEWEQKIDSELKCLNLYSSQTVKILLSK